MRDCKGDLAHVISSLVAISNADIAQGTTDFNFIYSSASRLFLSNFSVRDMSLYESGGLMTVIDSSQVDIFNASFSGIESSEQGLIYVHNSKVKAARMKVVNYNATFINSIGGDLAFAGLIVRNGLTTVEGQRLALIPNGGFLLCEDCPIVSIAFAEVREVSAKAGGVLYLFGQKGGRLEIANSLFANCRAVTAGGVASTTAYTIAISESQFVNNSARTGGVISTRAPLSAPVITRCHFQYNSALTDGSCIQWMGAQPEVADTVFEDNTALYGNPMASTPRFWHLIDPNTQLPTNQSLVGTTGQEMREPFVLGEFDAMGQLISTDNSSLVYLQAESYLNVSGSTEMVAISGLANFSLMFTPYFVGVVNITVTGGSADVIPYTFQYSLRDCEPGEIRKPNGCYPCPKNSYSLSPDDSTCSLCIDNAECWGRTDLRLYPNYWRYSILTDDIYECLNRGACLGGLNSDCAKGYRGLMCGVCERGYYRWGNWDCRSCDKETPAAVRAFLVAFLVITPAAILVETVVLPEGLWFNLAWSFRQLLIYTQSMTFIALLHARWSTSNLVYFEVLQSVGSFGSNFLYAECGDVSVSPFTARLIATALYPLILLGASPVVWACTRLFRRVSVKMIFVSFAVSVYHYIPVLLLMSAESFQCVEVVGRAYMVRDLSQECYTSEHLQSTLSVSIPLLVISTFLLGLYTKLLMSKSEKVRVLVLSQYLRAGYKSKSEGWEIFEVCRWLAVALFCVFFPQTEVQSQTIILSALFVLSVLVFGKCVPYQHLWMNILSLITHGSTISFLLVCFNTNGLPVTIAGGVFLCCLLVFSCVCSAKCRLPLNAVYPIAADDSISSEGYLAPYPSVKTSVLNNSTEAVFPLS